MQERGVVPGPAFFYAPAGHILPPDDPRTPPDHDHGYHDAMPDHASRHNKAIADRIEALRSNRARKTWDQSLRSTFLEASTLDRASERQFRGLAQAWEQMCPEDLLSKTRLIRYQRNVLTVGVDDSATLFALRRAASNSFRDTLAAQARVTLRRIELRLAEAEPV
ncbi:MAG: DciA family protein [Planctomycetota bacterium]|jgi:hypothetical protein